MVDLSVNFSGLRFKNPVVAASGHITHNFEHLRRCIEAGVGAVTLKSIVFDPQRWFRDARPRYFFLDKYGRRNMLTQGGGKGFISPEAGLKTLQKIRPIARDEGVVVIANIGAERPLDPKAIRETAKDLEREGADMVEVTLTCPLITVDPREGEELDREAATLVLNALKDELSIPSHLKFFYKSDPLLLDLLAIVEEGSSPAFHISMGIPSVFVDIEAGRPLVPVPKLYGPDFTGIGAYCTARAAKTTSLPIISGGGLWTYRDVVERIMCGATLTAVHTAVFHEGYKVLTRMIDGLAGYMERKGYWKLDDIKGVAVPSVTNPTFLADWVETHIVPKESVTISIDRDRCNGCGLCTACYNGAIEIKVDHAVIDLELCDRCGICASICARDAIAIRR